MPVFAQPFALSFTLTGAGFLIADVPFAVAYLPFGIALICTPRRRGHHRLAIGLMAGHFIWPALISGWGLIQLGVNPFLVGAGGLCVTALISAGISWLGIGLSAILLSAIPIFPASPLLVTGALLPGTGLWGLLALPGTGLWGLLALPLCLIVIEAQNRMALRAVLLAGLLALPPLVERVFDLPPAPVAAAAYDETDISHTVALTERGHWQQILSRTAPGDHLILGENIFDHDDQAAIFWWCRALKARQASAMIGVRGAGGTGEVWQIDATTCPLPRPVYRARIGIPWITGGWGPGTWPQTSHFAHLAHPAARFGAPPEPAWLICFEAFSLWRWIDIALPRPPHVVVLSNDQWTDPFPTAVLRRKVTRQFDHLFGIRTFHADSGVVFLRTRRTSQSNSGAGE